jgi:hypothetical protein
MASPGLPGRFQRARHDEEKAEFCPELPSPTAGFRKKAQTGKSWGFNSLPAIDQNSR